MIKVATDCSGIEAPIQAFRKMGIPIEHMWSSDIDKQVRESIKANYNPNILYTDITERNTNELPKVDWYIAGFPCQAFSQRGNMKGFEDRRGMLFFWILDTIKACDPNVFVLENVKGILSNDKGETFKRIVEELTALSDYHLEIFLLNSKDFGSVQSRERVFFVGVKKELIKREFEFPEMVERKVVLSDLLDKKVDKSYYRDLNEYKKHHNVTTDSDFLYDTCNPKSGPKLDVTTTRCILTSSRIYFSAVERLLTPREHLRLQGFPDDFKIVVPKTHAYKQAGNSMNIYALCALFKEIFRVIS